MLMIYEVMEAANHEEWVVEATGYDGEVYVALFSGPDARVRAEEYSDWKNSK